MIRRQLGPRRRYHIGARVDLKGITAELTKQVHILDGVTLYPFGKDGR